MKIIIIIVIFITFPNISYAYLDPGMGSYILAMLAAFFATLITFFSVFIQKLKIFLNKIKSLFKKKK
tara:strand:- start:1809 stop:2009 length:201 start_codon:yes stop_codon:yes gene_type:complete